MYLNPTKGFSALADKTGWHSLPVIQTSISRIHLRLFLSYKISEFCKKDSFHLPSKLNSVV